LESFADGRKAAARHQLPGDPRGEDAQPLEKLSPFDPRSTSLEGLADVQVAGRVAKD
jgi:hypothetical protein